MEQTQNQCFKQSLPHPGRQYVSSSFIRDRGSAILGVSDEWARGYSFSQTNNTPPIPLYVRVQPSQTNPKKMVFWINGWQQPRLFLVKGKNYSLNINTYGHPFYLTTDPHGGNGEVNNLIGVPASAYDKRTITIPCNSIDKFYYQCTLHPGMGGEVVVLDNFPSK
jgi:hypothetical protein